MGENQVHDERIEDDNAIIYKVPIHFNLLNISFKNLGFRIIGIIVALLESFAELVYQIISKCGKIIT